MHWAIRVRGWRGAHSTLHSSARPRVARAVQAARMAQAGVTRGMDSAMAGLGALLTPTIPATSVTRVNASLGSSMAVQLPAALMRETTRAAWLTGRRPEDVLEEALADWLAGYESAPVAALAPMRTASRQNSWGEIEETLRALRAS
jgi:hypothetical protein